MTGIKKIFNKRQSGSTGQFSLHLLAFFLLVISSVANNVYGQGVSRKHMSKKHEEYYDSLKNMNYDRVFPFWGDKVYKRGFDVPFPFGVMVNNFYVNQDINITNVNIGLRTPTGTLGPVNLDNIIEFSNVNSKSYNINVRPDVWIFPFLNVYGLLAYLPTAKTHVELSKPIQLTSEPKQSGWAYGMGIMGAFGFGPVWFQADYNMTWADMELLQNKVFTQVSGLRMGHVFTNPKNAEKNISIWIGMMGIFLNNVTIGEIPMTDIFPDISETKVNEAMQNYNANPALTAVQKDIMDKIIQKIKDRIHGLPVEDTYITYELDKAPKSKWSGLVGFQYQFSKRWQLRSECNFISEDRFTMMLSINYRFLGFRKKSHPFD